MAYCITKSMGMDRIKARVPAWLEAMRAGKAAAPKCGAELRSGGKCRAVRMRGGDRCHLHLHGQQRDAIDAQRAIRAAKALRSTNSRNRANGERALAVIARRQLHRRWKVYPLEAGSTLELTNDDEARVRSWLRNTHSIDLEHHPLHANGHPITARAIDRLRWAATLFLSGRMDAERAARRVFVAMRDDLKFWGKHG